MKDLKNDLAAIVDDKNLYMDEPPFYLKRAQWSCDSESMTCTQFTDLWRILYYKGDKALIQKWMNYLLGIDSFTFHNKTYDKIEGTAIEGDFKEVFSKKEYFNEYFNQLPYIFQIFQ